MDEITLRGLRFHVLVGVLPHEREHPQPLEIDLTVQVLPGDGVVDYRRLYAAAADTLGVGPLEYLEDVGDRIGRAALACSERVSHARVAVRKPHVALGGPLDYAEVVVQRARADA
jgi:dihydroneopterin aldolase